MSKKTIRQIHMKCNRYRELVLKKSSNLSETTKKYTYITERHLQAVWLEQKYYKNLVTSYGRSIQVISPGIWNSEAGPDFLKAHLLIDGKEVIGDVEIHLLDESWKAHRHDNDPNYNRVVLHLSLWKPNNEISLIREDGIELEKAYFQEALTIPLTRIVQLIDLNLYPYKKFVGSGRCARDLFKSLPESQTIDFLQEAAFWRFLQKGAWLREKLHDPSLFFPGGMAAALGYKKNTETFLEIFNWILNVNLLDENNLLSLAMLGMGFFSKKYQEKWKESKKYQDLYTYSQNFSDIPRPNFLLNLDRVRPQNHPIRRVVYLIKLIKDEKTPNLLNILKKSWKSGWSQLHSHKSAGTFHQNLLEIIPEFEDTYWNQHFLFETSEKDHFIPLIGDSYKYNVLINTFFPLLYNEIKDDPDQVSAFEMLLSFFPGGKSGKTKYLKHRFFGDSLKGEILKKGYIEQGAFQLHTDFCTHYEASCHGCPFVDKFREIYCP